MKKGKTLIAALAVITAVSTGVVEFGAISTARAQDRTELRDQGQRFLNTFQDTSRPLSERMKAFAAYSKLMGNDYPAAVVAATGVMDDQIEQAGDSAPILVDENAQRAYDTLMDALIRKNGKYPVLTGGVGSGKSALLELLARNINAGEYPDGAHAMVLKPAKVFTISARRFLPGGMDMAAYISTLKFIGEGLDINPILAISDAHFLKPYHFSILVEEAGKPDHVPVIIEADDNSYSVAVSGEERFARYTIPIRLSAPSAQAVTELFDKAGITKSLEDRYGVVIAPEVLAAATELSADYRPGLADPTRTMVLLEDVAIDMAHQTSGRIHELTKGDVYRFVAKRAGVPVVPQDREAFMEYMQGVRERVRAKVIGQDHIVDGLVDQFIDALTSKSRKHSVAMIMGPTGVGKSYVAEVLADEYFHSKEKILELDMTQFKDSSHVNTLFGASNGYVSSDKTKGVVCEYLDGRGAGGGMIVMNEFEEAHADVITRLMEMFDKGEVRGGDGKVRYLRNMLIVLTSNKQSQVILTPDRIRGMSKKELQDYVRNISAEQLKKAWTEKASYTEDSSNQVKGAVVERIDRWYYAKPQLNDEALQITQLEVMKYVNEQGKVNGLDIQVDESFAETLVSAFYNEQNGARQLKNMIRQSLGNAVRAFQSKFGYKAQKLMVSASLHPTHKTHSFITVSGADQDQTITVEGPTVPNVNKLFDADVRERLQNLEANIRSEIFGQDEAVKIVAGAIKSRFLNPTKKSSTAGFLLGTTGTGKTEIGKLIAKYGFERPDAYAVFEMGKIQDRHDMSDIFSPAKGIIGSDQPGQLEQFLSKFPDGGVLIFDEMSNAGGNDVGLKNAIMKMFYGMVTEGLFRTPSGKEYDLSKYIILFTGNDGEEEFRGLSSDVMIEQTYQEFLQHPEKVKEILKKAGFSDAFLGRLAFSFMMRPAMSDTRIKIAEKLLAKWVKSVEATQPFTFRFDEAFVSQMAEHLFTPTRGARSMDEFIETTMGQVVADVALQFDWEDLTSRGQKGEIAISADISKPAGYYYEDAPHKNKAVLKVVATLEGHTVASDEVEFTNTAVFRPQVHKEDAWATAIHEMGHAIASFSQITGKHPIKINIIPERVGDLSTLGYALYDEKPVKGGSTYTRDRLVKEVAGLLAGSEAETLLANQPRNVGRSNDLEKVGKLTRRVILDSHLIPELDGAHAYANAQDKTNIQLPAREQKIFDDYVNDVIEEARALALKTIKDNAHTVFAGAELLMKYGSLNEKEIERLFAAGERAKKDVGFVKRKAVEAGFLPASKAYKVDVAGVMDSSSEAVEQGEKSCETLIHPS